MLVVPMGETFWGRRNQTMLGNMRTAVLFFFRVVCVCGVPIWERVYGLISSCGGHVTCRSCDVQVLYMPHIYHMLLPCQGLYDVTGLCHVTPIEHGNEQ